MNDPIEKFIKINGLHPFYEGKVTVTKLNEKYCSEIAIVHTETQKIFQYVDTLYGQDDPKEALDLGVQILSKYLLKK